MAGEPNDRTGRVRHAWAPLAWYAAVAGFNAVFYFCLCTALSAMLFNPSAAAVIALVPVLVVSYLGHKTKTFESRGAHRREAPRFLALSVMDLALAAAAPYLATRAGLTPLFAFAALTAVVPLANFLIMRFWVFREREPHAR